MFQVSEVPSYAGFWRRVGAASLDGLIVCLIEELLRFPWHHGVSVMALQNELIGGITTVPPLLVMFFCLVPLIITKPATLLALNLGPLIVSLLVNWLYHALMESSAKQATPGKMLLEIQVTDLTGQRISFGRATSRHFGKILSTLMLLIGFLMAGWTKKKQALHDKLSNCLVVKKPRSPVCT